MKKIILLSALLIAGISINAQNARSQSSAQQTQGAEQKATKQTDKLDKAVTLTADQKKKAHAINFEKNKAIDAAATNKDTFEAEKSKLNEERKKELLAILTPEQQVKFNKAAEDKAEQKEKAAQK